MTEVEYAVEHFRKQLTDVFTRELKRRKFCILYDDRSVLVDIGVEWAREGDDANTESQASGEEIQETRDGA